MNIYRINSIQTNFAQGIDAKKSKSSSDEQPVKAEKRRIGFFKKDKSEISGDTFETSGKTMKEIQLRNKIDRIKAEQKIKGTSFKGTIERTTPEVEFEYIFKEKQVQINEDNTESIMTSFKPMKTFYSLQEMPKEFLLKQVEGADNLSYFEMSEDKPFGKTLKVEKNTKDGTAKITEGKLSLFKKEKQISTETINLSRMNFNEFVSMIITNADKIGKAKVRTEVPLVFQ